MFNRIFGIETEYGLLINSDDPDHSPSWLAHRVIDQVFRVREQGVLDLHYRGYDEPPGNGGFCFDAENTIEHDRASGLIGCGVKHRK